MKPGGTLIFTIPSGKDMVCFNGYRQWDPRKPVKALNELELIEFSAVENCELKLSASIDDYVDHPGFLAMYLFKKPE